MEILEQDVPLRLDDQGAVRVGETRVLFDSVIRSYLRGDTPEDIVREYPTLSLADTYGAIAYYLQHRDQVEEYLQRREEQATEVRNKLQEAGIAVDADVFLDREETSE
ncbi:MAG: hypothetical protein BRD28_02395 [Bacteroidetes bacterium QH_10_64_37]|nr:MAG: hypothetical protein BRD28_02395 [Bacteroidetes bacterium QH_10_64_37]